MEPHHFIPLQKIILEKLIPWTQSNPHKLILATEKHGDLRLPRAITSSIAKPLGKKQRVRGRKAYNNHITIEQWPNEGQETLRTPMVWCVIEGELQLRCGEYFLHLLPGYPLIIPPGTPHPGGIKYDPPNRFCDVFIISPRGRQMQCWLTEHRNGEVCQTQNVSILNTFPADDLDRIVEELIRNDEISSSLACHFLSAIWLTIVRELQQEHFVEILPSALNIPKPATYDPIFSAQRYIQSHLHQNLTIEKIAKVVHLSRTQFIVLFRQQTGQSFLEYTTKLRIEWACQLLKETGWTVSYIGTFVGFKSPVYFHRLFRRKVGLTPGRYRKQASNDLSKKSV